MCLGVNPRPIVVRATIILAILGGAVVFGLMSLVLSACYSYTNNDFKNTMVVHATGSDGLRNLTFAEKNTAIEEIVETTTEVAETIYEDDVAESTMRNTPSETSTELYVNTYDYRKFNVVVPATESQRNASEHDITDSNVEATNGTLTYHNRILYALTNDFVRYRILTAQTPKNKSKYTSRKIKTRTE